MRIESMKVVGGADVSFSAGVMVWWRAAPAVKYGAIAAAWPTELANDLRPEPTTGARALRTALQAQTSDRVLLRPLNRRAAWALVAETVELAPDDVKNSDLHYAKSLAIELVGDIDLLFSDDADARCGAIMDAFSDALVTLDRNQISDWLSAHLIRAVGGVSLRPRGGIYFVPKAQAPLWDSISAMLTATGAATVYTVPVYDSEQAVAGVLDALIDEANDTLAEVEAGLETANRRGLATRARLANDLQTKLSHYADLLGDRLKDITSRVQSAQVAVATAEVLAMGDA